MEEKKNLVDILREEPGRVHVEWAPMVVRARDFVRGATHDVELWTLADAVRLDERRVGVDAVTLQHLADALGAVVATPRLLDWRYRWACDYGLRIDPVFNDGKKTIAALMDPITYDDLVDDEVQRAKERGLNRHQEITHELFDSAVMAVLAGACPPHVVAGEGKSWVLTNRQGQRLATGEMAAWNYGWIAPQRWIRSSVTPCDPTIPMMGHYTAQPLSGRHNQRHVDPSQLAFALFKDECGLRALEDYQRWSLRDLLQSDRPEVYALSHEGPLREVRITGVGEAGR